MKHGVTRNKVYEYIKQYRAENGFAPSYREIADALGLGIATVEHHVLHLRGDGLISYKTGIPRSIVVL